MPLQSNIVSGGKRKRNQIAELNARQSMLPQIMANKQRREDLDRAEENKNIQINQFNRQHALAKKGQKAQEKGARIGMGLEMAKLAPTLMTQFGDKKLGGMSMGNIGGGIVGGYGLGKMLSKKKGAGYIGAGLGALAGGFGSALGKLF